MRDIDQILSSADLWGDSAVAALLYGCCAKSTMKTTQAACSLAGVLEGVYSHFFAVCWRHKIAVCVPRTLEMCRSKEGLFDALEAYPFRKAKLDA